VQKSSSIYARLMVAALLPLLLGMAAAFLIATAIFTRVLESRVAAQAEHAAQVLASSRLALTPELLRRVAQLQRTDFVLLDAEGAVAGSSYETVPAAVSAVLAAHRGGPPAQREVAHFDLGGEPSIAVYAPILAPGDARVAVLLIVASLRDARTAAWRAASGVALAVLVAAVLLAALLRYRIGSITRPLERLAAFASNVAAGQRDARLPVSGHDELASLARTLNDMTERIATYERQLAAQSRLSALGEMAARIAHEVRNPLTGLKMQLQLLAERAAESEQRLLGNLLDEVKRLELIVDASLTLARDRPARREPTDLARLAADVVELLEPSFAHRSIRIATRYETLPPITADPALLRQALLNLLVNAADALPEGGRILLSTACAASGGRVILSVADSGPGLTPERAAELAAGPSSSKPFGLGLGLSVCREVANAHGGEFVMTRHSELGGAGFALELPAAAAANPVEGAA
jgi:signal transduction histidine kinase